MIVPTPAKHDPASPPIEAEQISVYFNGTIALEDISFRLDSGKRIAIVGPNGAGKTTLFKIIAGTLKPTRGAVHVYGHGPDGHVCIAYVPQRSQVDWEFPATVKDVVMMGRVRKIGLFRWPTKKDWSFVRKALLRMGVQDLEDRQINELSGGQQQRVFLAQALAQEAEVLLLDEPFSGLDLPSQESIFSILNELKKEGVTALVSTHDLNLAAERFDQVMLLNRRIIAFGAPAEVLTSPALMKAYGGHVHAIEEEGSLIVLTDSCCDGDEEHAG